MVMFKLRSCFFFFLLLLLFVFIICIKLCFFFLLCVFFLIVSFFIDKKYNCINENIIIEIIERESGVIRNGS